MNNKLIYKKPITPSLRNRKQIDKKSLAKKPFIKNSCTKTVNSSGRNNSGKITVRHKGGGNKKKFRIIQFYRNLTSTGIVIALEYDPNRNANIASVFDIKRVTFFYVIATKSLKIGDIIESGSDIEPKSGNSLPLSKIPAGSFISSVSTKLAKHATVARSAGTFCYLLEKTIDQARIRLCSGAQLFVSLKCFATVGVVSNASFFLIRASKAGQSRWLNKRPTVRGVAMNPVDHPHGGGEGKKSGKGLTLWGRNTKIGKTSRSVAIRK